MVTVSTSGMKLSDLKPLIGLIEETTGLDENQAKTIIYFASASYALPRLDKFPILAIYGTAATGKSTLLDILSRLSYSPRMIDGKSTGPTLRDDLEFETTTLIDEADDINEKLLINRYSRQSGTVSFKKKTPTGSWTQEKPNLFGASVLHRRIPFKDYAVLSRAIMIKTGRHEVSTYQSIKFEPYAEVLKSLSDEAPWSELESSQGNRIADTWEPLVFVSLVELDDEEWYEYALEQIQKSNDDLKLGEEEEPTRAIYFAFLALALDGQSEPKERVRLAAIANRLNNEGRKLTSYQAGQVLGDLGFERRTVGGNSYVYTGGGEKLRQVGNQLGVKDEWLEMGRV